LRICQDLGSPDLLPIPQRAPGLGPRRAIPGTRDALELARDRADRVGIRIAFEFLGFGDCPINTPEIATETVDGIDSVDLVLDSCHWHASGSRPLTSFPIDRLALVHLNDAPDKPPREIEDADRLLPGEGVIQLKTLTRARQCAGTAGPLPAPASQTLAAAEFASSISDDSSIASNCEAGIVFSSLSRLSGQAASSVPLKNQLLPLSARIIPKCCIASRMTWAWALKCEMS